MRQIKEMIESALTKSDAINMLNTWRLFGKITDKQYSKGRELISQEFSN